MSHLIILGLLVVIVYFVIVNNKKEGFANYGDAGCPAGTRPGVNQAGVQDCIAIPLTRRNLGN